MRKLCPLLVVLLCVFHSLSAFDVGLHFDQAGCSMSAQTNAYFRDAVTISATAVFSHDNWFVSPLIGIGAIPISVFSIDGTKVLSAYSLMPLVGIQGGYSIIICESAFSIPLGLTMKVNFPNLSESNNDIKTATNANMTFNAGIAAKLKQFRISIGGNIFILRADTNGSLFFLSEGIQGGLYSGITIEI